MKLSALFLASLASAAAPDNAAPAAAAVEHLFSNPTDPAAAAALRIPTSRESAVMARRILALTRHSVFSTNFPLGSAHAGVPVGLGDYIADCENTGNPTVLSMRIGTSFRNVAHGSNISLALSWVPPYPPARRIRSSSSASSYLPTFLTSLLGWEEDEDDKKPDPAPFSAANLPRFSLMGRLEKIEPEKHLSVAQCYVAAHPDARYWLPGNPIHESEWARLVVDSVYWIGGFGDRAYIGWIPVDEWTGVTRDEWEAIRLPGEKPGWKEWAVEEAGDL